MKLVAGSLNGNHLKELLLNAPQDIEWVKVAVAYASGTPELIDFCVERKLRLEFWGRLDPSVPVTLNILDRFLRLGPNYTCKLIWKHYHPKVIWWGGYGAYIGSANLTDNGWNKNIECGLFLSESELISQGIFEDLQEIFEGIDEHSVPLTQEILNRLKDHEHLFHSSVSDLQRAENEREREFERQLESVVAKKFKGLSVITKKSARDRQREKFLAEWSDTIQLIRQVSDQVSEDRYRPVWIEPTVSKGVQVDQFLHGYYYHFVKQGNRSHHEEFFVKNRNSPQAALTTALEWWKSLPKAPTSEQTAIDIHAPYLAARFSSNGLRSLNQEDWVQACGYIYAFWAAARQTQNQVIGLPANTNMKLDERIKVVANWIWGQQSGNGSSVRQTINYVLYGGPEENLAMRLWEAAYEEDWHIPQFGLSCLGELTGWAMPDKFPPRNGRTSKALRALGFNVRVHSE